MEKLVISKEIEESLGRFTTTYGIKENAMEVFTNKGIYADLQQYTPEQFALLLCGWYEVEEPFKVGDWIVVTFELHSTIYGKTMEITDVKKSYAVGKNFSYELDGEGTVFDNEIRHATAEEFAQEKKRRLWANLGREVGEFKKGDILMNPFGELRFCTIDFAKDDYESILVTPVENRVDL